MDAREYQAKHETQLDWHHSINQSISHLQHGAGCVSKEILYLGFP